jgi:hypothetical protein
MIGFLLKDSTVGDFFVDGRVGCVRCSGFAGDFVFCVLLI